jgi:TonB family protein
MIDRLLVPRDARLAQTPSSSPPQRLTTLLDDRTVVGADFPLIVLDPRTSIPSHLPLGALASRVVVPRDMPMTPFGAASLHRGAPLTAMDQRIAVPAALPVVEFASKPLVAIQDLPPVLEPDVLTTGEVNLMGSTEEQRPADWTWLGRVGSVGAHALILLLLIFQSRLFPYRPPTQEQVDIARNQLSFIYMPPDVRGTPVPVAPRAPAVRIDPRILRQIAPSELQPIPAPRVPDRAVPDRPRDAAPEAPPELPVAPKPQQPVERASDFLRGGSAPPAPTKTEPANGGLVLPQISSPGRTLEQSAQQAIKGSGGGLQSGGPIPGGGRGGPGQRSGQAETGLTMLTPTEGVDFSSYLARVLESVKQNWYAVMPESARLGDQGTVVLQFRIMRDGGVPPAEPQLMSGSGKDPLDRAAISSIKSSSPFEPLPSAFSSPYIELRFIFLYNPPANYKYQ